MRPRTHAMNGARSIGAVPRVAGWGDAFASTQLVEDPTLTTPESVRVTRQLVQSGHDPVSAARAWIQLHAAAADWTTERETLVDALLAAASDHFAQIDVVATAAARSGDIAGIAEVDRMANDLREFALRLRALLDPATQASGSVDVDQQLAKALGAARAGGFAGLVVALG